MSTLWGRDLISRKKTGSISIRIGVKSVEVTLFRNQKLERRPEDERLGPYDQGEEKSARRC